MRQMPIRDMLRLKCFETYKEEEGGGGRGGGRKKEKEEKKKQITEYTDQKL